MMYVIRLMLTLSTVHPICLDYSSLLRQFDCVENHGQSALSMVT